MENRLQKVLPKRLHLSQRGHAGSILIYVYLMNLRYMLLLYARGEEGIPPLVMMETDVRRAYDVRQSFLFSVVKNELPTEVHRLDSMGM